MTDTAADMEPAPDTSWVEMVEIKDYKPGTPPRCVYALCRETAVGEYPRGRNSPWPLCDNHAQQKHHPDDIDMRRFVRYGETTDGT